MCTVPCISRAGVAWVEGVQAVASLPGRVAAFRRWAEPDPGVRDADVQMPQAASQPPAGAGPSGSGGPAAGFFGGFLAGYRSHTCVWRCPGRRSVVLAFRWRREAIWKFSATRSAKVRHRWKGSLLSSETAFVGWALWRPATQALRDAKSWQTKLEATRRSSAVMRKFLGEAVVFRIQVRTRSVPLRLL